MSRPPNDPPYEERIWFRIDRKTLDALHAASGIGKRSDFIRKAVRERLAGKISTFPWQNRKAAEHALRNLQRRQRNHEIFTEHVMACPRCAPIQRRYCDEALYLREQVDRYPLPEENPRK
jgi:hypothetical protein